MQEVLPSVGPCCFKSGATTLAELTALGVASVLIPSPYVTNNHQEKNALSLSTNGAAILIKEQDLTNNLFVEMIDSVLLESEKEKKKKKSAKRIGIPDAAERLYKVLLELVQEK